MNRTIAATMALAIAAVSAPSVQAQTAPTQRGFEFLVSSGKVLPTGDQRDAIKQGNLTAAQLSYAVTPNFAIMSTIGWARSRDIATQGDPKLDVFTYDLGAEVRAPRWIEGGALSLSPFAGVGAGARSYNYRKLDVDATHNLAAYASAGGEIGYKKVHLRLEARDYVTGFKPLVGSGVANTRNDVAIIAGLRFGTR